MKTAGDRKGRPYKKDKTITGGESMGTTWEELEARAMTYIKDDLSLEDDMRNRLPVFYNRMRAYMVEAIPVFNRPPEMMQRLAAYTAPQFESVSYTAVGGITAGTVIQTGVTGADLASVGVIAEDEYGEVSYLPFTAFSYDAESGNVTIQQDISVSDTIEIDLYTSGSFSMELNDTEKGILAFAIYNRYEHRFDNDVLERTAKIRDSSFSTISEASQTQANTARQKLADSQLFEMMRAYQDNIEWWRVRNRSGAWPI